MNKDEVGEHINIGSVTTLSVAVVHSEIAFASQSIASNPWDVCT